MFICLGFFAVQSCHGNVAAQLASGLKGEQLHLLAYAFSTISVNDRDKRIAPVDSGLLLFDGTRVSINN